GAVDAGGLDGVFSGWQQARSSSLISDHVYNWSDSTGGKYIFQPFCLGLASCSRRVANSKSESASSRRGGKSSELYGDGSAQSVRVSECEPGGPTKPGSCRREVPARSRPGSALRHIPVSRRYPPRPHPLHPYWTSPVARPLAGCPADRPYRREA